MVSVARTSCSSGPQLRSSGKMGPYSVSRSSVLGPLFFIVVFNDAVGKMNVTARLFANDCILYIEVTKKGDQICLNNYIRRVEERCVKWQTMFNIGKKTACMIATQNSSLRLSISTLSGSVIQRVDSYKHLGVTITGDFSRDVHFTNIARKANTKLWFLRRYLKQALNESKPPTYKTLDRPLL